MTRLRWTLGFALALSAVATPAAATPVAATSVAGATVAFDIRDDFDEGVQLFRQGRLDEARAAFQRVLAADPSNEDAYELWKETDQQVILEMLLADGEFKQIAEAISARATLARAERRNDASAIGELVNELRSATEPLDRQRIVHTLSAEHGEYAVPRLLPALADAGDEEWRVLAMHTLVRMGPYAVLPLISALETDNAYQRANVAIVLGHIGDHRAAPTLAGLARTDDDTKVQSAAGVAAEKCGSSGDPVAEFLRLGEDYHYRRDNVLRPFDYSDVLWGWDGGLVSAPVRREIYNNELAKWAYYEALALDPSSLDALAGIARESTDELAKLEALAEQGEDVDDLLEQARIGSLAVSAAGIPAIDRALSWSVVTDDAGSGIHLCRALGDLAVSPTEGLRAALDSSDGGMQGEAAVALGHIAARTGSSAGAAVVAALGNNVGREVVRIVVVIDGDAARAEALVGAIGAQGAVVNHRGSGAQGIALLQRLPGLDAILVGDDLPDLAFDRVLSAIAQNPVTASVPVMLVTGDEELADAYSDRVTASLAGAGDISALDEVFEASLTGDRAAADDLSRRSAEVLTILARAGNSDLSGILNDLAQPLAYRDDAVVLPTLAALAAAGGAGEIGVLAGVVASAERSDAARAAAADAVGEILGRTNAGADAVAPLVEVLGTDAPLAVRAAVARAIGRAQLGAGDRQGLLEAVRIRVQGGE